MPKGIYKRIKKNTGSGWHKGKKFSEEHKIKLIEARTGEKNHNWKGDRVGKRSIHNWITRKYGKPMVCEHCYISELEGHKINWANKDHKYKREREKWLRLCIKCHRLYDKLNNNGGKNNYTRMIKSIDKNGVERIYKNIKLASDVTHTSLTGIINVARGRQITSNSLKWSYINNQE